ncbi:MAG: hypothetical protein Ct9H90mP27_2930 [Gammaproteobacteria bacterium]|nr:MAG: hypothetical protein Ct9H90mP27_2930 [Gammaproteobacteria bacterium]
MNFKPQPGRISDCDFPEQQNIQVISTQEREGGLTLLRSLLAQVIVHSDTEKMRSSNLSTIRKSQIDWDKHQYSSIEINFEGQGFEKGYRYWVPVGVART